MVRYRINNGNIINLLDVNILIVKVMELIIIQFKTFYNKIILRCQMNGNIIILSILRIILKPWYKLKMDKYQINNIIMIQYKVI